MSAPINSSGIFNPKTVLILVIIGVFSFAAFITVSGFADSLRSEDNGRAHALSKSPNGFAGIVHLLNSQELYAGVRRNDGKPTPYALTVYTLPNPYVSEAISELALDTPTLLVLPKWFTSPSRKERGRVIRQSLYDAEDIEELFKPLDFDATLVRADDIKTATQLSIKSMVGSKSDIARISGFTVTTVDELQLIDSKYLSPIISSATGVLLGQIDGTKTYILSDPDILNNAGLKSRSSAGFAVELFDAFTGSAQVDEISFDVTLHGLGLSENLIKVMLRPPFLSATLCILAVGGLLGWCAFARFGIAQTQSREFALGKKALADNSAELIRLAGREPFMATRYADVIRNEVASSVRMPKTLNETALIESLDRMGERSPSNLKFSTLNRQAKNADDISSLMHIAQKLYTWKQEITHGRD